MSTTTRAEFYGDTLGSEALVALLAEFPFDAFEEADDSSAANEGPLVAAYAKTAKLNDEITTDLRDLARRFDLRVRLEQLPDVNYNARWEAGYQPVKIGDWLRVRAPFHDPGVGYAHELVIVPEMSFGTGHHATTTLMAELLRDCPLDGAAVFDFGTGTGVLALLARLLGARRVDATDIDPRCVRSARANAARNGLALDELREGTEASLPDGPYDLVLANINRGVLLAAMGELAARLAESGELWLSGILEGDLEVVDRAAFDGGLTRIELRRRAGWLALRYGRKRI